MNKRIINKMMEGFKAGYQFRIYRHTLEKQPEEAGSKFFRFKKSETPNFYWLELLVYDKLGTPLTITIGRSELKATTIFLEVVEYSHLTFTDENTVYLNLNDVVF